MLTPNQPLLGRDGRALPFLSWIREAPPLAATPYPETVLQLKRTFFHVALEAGLSLGMDEPTFLAETCKPGLALVRQPCLFLRFKRHCYLRFDYLAWLQDTGYVLAPGRRS